MEFSAADFERLLMFEHARKASEAQYLNDPLDSEVCTRLLSIIYGFYNCSVWITLLLSLDFIYVMLAPY